MESIIQALINHPFFEGMATKHIETIAEQASEVEYNVGDYVFHEGREATYFYLVLDGEISLQTFVPGRGFTGIQTIHGNEVIGWSWLIEPYRWNFSGLVAMPTKAIRINAKNLRETFEDNPELGYAVVKRFLALVGQRLSMTRKQMSEEVS